MGDFASYFMFVVYDCDKHDKLNPRSYIQDGMDVSWDMSLIRITSEKFEGWCIIMFIDQSYNNHTAIFININ